MDLLYTALQSGFAGLASYLAAHVLLCLVPAFFVAGALSAFVPQSSVIRFVGPKAPKWIAYPAAAGVGSLLAVCSCTVQPLFAGIYRKGAGLGPAITFLFFAPAANILALSYTGVALGPEFAVARVVLSLTFGVGIGMIMALLFRGDDATRLGNAPSFTTSERISGRNVTLIVTLVALLIGGTLKVFPLTAQLTTFSLASSAALPAQQLLDRLVPVDVIKGNEGLTLQGVVLIGLLLLIGATATRGLGSVDKGFNWSTGVSLSLTAATLVFAALGVHATAGEVVVVVTGRSMAVSALLLLLAFLGRRVDAWERQQWLWETWRFVCQIFPLLVVGVFLVGIVRLFIRPEWVQSIAGTNSVTGNLAGVGFGVFMYFPTLVEVPIARMLLSLGMHPGPLIAYLMADPELSLQSILITSAIVGKTKAWTYVALVALFSTVSGLAYGAWVDGMPVGVIAMLIALLVGAMSAALYVVRHRRPSTLA